MEQIEKKTKRTKRTADSFADRKGYDENFIQAKGFKIKLNSLLKNHTT
jgi:hypothetical protein